MPAGLNRQIAKLKKKSMHPTQKIRAVMDLKKHLVKDMYIWQLLSVKNNHVFPSYSVVFRLTSEWSRDQFSLRSVFCFAEI